jgi:2-polyprenyl-6-hydroxyphenyl methylase/3-demethylubiquinone-9 3-methyltransferase
MAMSDRQLRWYRENDLKRLRVHIDNAPLTVRCREREGGGTMFVATLNKTLKALALAKIGAEYVLGWLPRGTHDWNRFLPPTELRAMLEQAGLSVWKTQGVSFDPLNWDWRVSRDVDVNYMVVAGR